MNPKWALEAFHDLNIRSRRTWCHPGKGANIPIEKSLEGLMTMASQSKGQLVTVCAHRVFWRVQLVVRIWSN